MENSKLLTPVDIMFGACCDDLPFWDGKEDIETMQKEERLALEEMEASRKDDVVVAETPKRPRAEAWSSLSYALMDISRAVHNKATDAEKLESELIEGLKARFDALGYDITIRPTKGTKAKPVKYTEPDPVSKKDVA